MFVSNRALNLSDGYQGLHLMIVSPLFLTLALAAVIGRLLARKMKRIKLAADDYWVILALVLPSSHTQSKQLLIVLLDIDMWPQHYRYHRLVSSAL